MEVIMGNDKATGLASLSLSDEKEKEILARSFRMLDYLNDMATEILMEFVHNASCPVAKQALLNSPELLAVKAFEKAISDLNTAFRKPEVSMN
jgi:hypothetical protein